MRSTGKFLTQQQIADIQAALMSPYILGSGGTPPASPQMMVHACALDNGLPEIVGYYGADLRTGEILVP